MKVVKLLDEFEVLSSRTLIILDQGDDSEMNKYISKVDIIMDFIWDLFCWSNFLYLSSLFFANKISKISLAERKECMAIRKAKRPRINNPQSRQDDLITKGTKRQAKGDVLIKSRNKMWVPQLLLRIRWFGSLKQMGLVSIHHPQRMVCLPNPPRRMIPHLKP